MSEKLFCLYKLTFSVNVLKFEQQIGETNTICVGRRLNLYIAAGSCGYEAQKSLNDLTDIKQITR
jgi:hypothetical protein